MHAISADLAVQRSVLRKLHIDRAYLSSLLVRERPTELAVYCKAWPVRNGTRFPKTAFQLHWRHRLIECPNRVVLPFEPRGVVHLPAATSAACPLRELRQRQFTQVGRAKLRERGVVGHALAHIGRWQGRRHAIVACAKTCLTCTVALWFITGM